MTLLDASNRAELYPPADHTAVFTVGDAGPASSVGPTLDGRIKPDAVLLDSRVDFTDGMITAGSSNAAAELAGIAAVLKAAEPRMTPRHLFALARQSPRLDPRADRAQAQPPRLADAHPREARRGRPGAVTGWSDRDRQMTWEIIGR